MAESVVKSYFPSQVVSDVEKISYEYGLKIAKAIESEWFNSNQGGRYKKYQTIWMYITTLGFSVSFLVSLSIELVVKDITAASRR